MAVARSQLGGIALSLLRRCRTVLSRESDASGKVVWVAAIPDFPGYRATGPSRIEALDRLRQMAKRRSDDGGIRRGIRTKSSNAAGAAAGGGGLSRVRALEGRHPDGVRGGEAEG